MVMACFDWPDTAMGRDSKNKQGKINDGVLFYTPMGIPIGLS